MKKALMCVVAPLAASGSGAMNEDENGFECIDPYGIGCRDEAVVFRRAQAAISLPWNLNFSEECSPDINFMVGLCSECCWAEADTEDLDETRVDLDGLLMEFATHEELFGLPSTRRNFFCRELF